jgi:hypothetical protein
MKRVEQLLAKALMSRDAGEALQKAARDRRTPPALRRALKNVDADGARLAGLLIVRLRFERLMNGSDAASQAFESDPKGFAKAFERYHREVPPTEHFPAGEARLFERWANKGDRPLFHS